TPNKSDWYARYSSRPRQDVRTERVDVESHADHVHRVARKRHGDATGDQYANASTYDFPRQCTCALRGFPGRIHRETSTGHLARIARTIRQNAPHPARRYLAIHSSAGFVAGSSFGADAGLGPGLPADSMVGAVADPLAMHAVLGPCAGPALAPSPSLLLLLLHALLPGTVLVAYDPFIIRIVKAALALLTFLRIVLTQQIDPRVALGLQTGLLTLEQVHIIMGDDAHGGIHQTAERQAAIQHFTRRSFGLKHPYFQQSAINR